MNILFFLVSIFSYAMCSEHTELVDSASAKRKSDHVESLYKKLPTYTTAQPERRSFVSDEEFEGAWKEWRRIRDENNEAVRRCRARRREGISLKDSSGRAPTKEEKTKACTFSITPLPITVSPGSTVTGVAEQHDRDRMRSAYIAISVLHAATEKYSKDIVYGPAVEYSTSPAAPSPLMQSESTVAVSTGISSPMQGSIPSSVMGYYYVPHLLPPYMFSTQLVASPEGHPGVLWWN